MGIEYNIKFNIPANFDFDKFKTKLNNPVENNWPAFNLDMNESGFYFCDHTGQQEVAALALRKIIDEALSYSQSITIEEA